MGTVRLTVTISKEDYRKIEEIKKKKGVNRSAVVREIIELYFKNEKERFSDQQYKEGYHRNPERSVIAMDKIQSETIGKF